MHSGGIDLLSLFFVCFLFVIFCSLTLTFNHIRRKTKFVNISTLKTSYNSFQYTKLFENSTNVYMKEANAFINDLISSVEKHKVEKNQNLFDVGKISIPLVVKLEDTT